MPVKEKQFKLTKAASANLEDLPIPCFVGTKYDGIRAVVRDSVVLSLTLKPIPNRHIQAMFGKPQYNDLDMELTIGDIYSPDCFRNTTSIVMSHDKLPTGLQAFVFDKVTTPDEPYEVRKQQVIDTLEAYPDHRLVEATAELVNTFEELEALYEAQRVLGGEGLIGRKQGSKYKYGRSTLKEGILYKIKFYKQAEFTVVGFVEQMQNTNEAQVSETGNTVRSLAKDGLIPKATLGSLKLKMPDGRVFCCGTGFSDDLRQEIWNDREAYIGLQASVRYMATGIKDAPRHPVFLGFRDEDDIDDTY